VALPCPLFLPDFIYIYLGKDTGVVVPSASTYSKLTSSFHSVFVLCISSINGGTCPVQIFQPSKTTHQTGKQLDRAQRITWIRWMPGTDTKGIASDYI
jgi:hypothetical protein